MEQRNNLVLQGTETFSRGQLDNVALDNGSVVLDPIPAPVAYGVFQVTLSVLTSILIPRSQPWPW